MFVLVREVTRMMLSQKCSHVDALMFSFFLKYLLRCMHIPKELEKLHTVDHKTIHTSTKGNKKKTTNKKPTDMTY